tara:strand:+ start:279 stop:638 length:360 start_codon:yes stop_codon:yes gene_type:complete
MKGSILWNIQRYSSLFILAYFIYILSFFVTTEEINFYSWSEFFLSLRSKFFTSIAFLMIISHAYIGLWTVGTDYLTERTLGFLNNSLANRAGLLRNLYFFIFVTSGIFYLITVLYIVWL